MAAAPKSADSQAPELVDVAKALLGVINETCSDGSRLSHDTALSALAMVAGCIAATTDNPIERLLYVTGLIGMEIGIESARHDYEESAALDEKGAP